MGYALGEVQGKHDSMFVEPAERASAAYREFWAKLNRGESQSAEYRRIGKGGKEVWIQATYSPIADENGRLCKVVTFATDVTKQKLRMADLEGQMAAIDKSQAVVEFGMDGTVTTANNNFLKTLGYSVKEIQGKHHGMFVEASERSSLAYREFWTKLNRGEPQSAEYKRVGKDGKEIWVQASYNPVLDSKGKPTKVVELATDITAKKIEALENAAQVAAIERSQAVAAFNPDGTIITANKNFLNAMGYALGEVQGKHDSMFVEPAERASAAYREFWAKLNRGESQSAEYKRIGKNGKEVWIHALYSPILGLNGRPLKIVTYVKEMSASIREIYETMIKPEESVHAAAIRQGFAGEIQHAKQDTEAGSLSLSMRRLEARRRSAAGRSKFSQFLENLRDGFSNTMMSSSRAVVNFL
jgi:methyl-accepting chemotaxis protein